MLNAKNLLKSLSGVEDEQNLKYENDDYDFGEVLKHNHEIRYSDGEKRIFFI